MPHDRNAHEQPAQEPTPETALKRTACAPELDPITNVVKADHLFFRMISLADDAQIF
jgi:hypothetical protein